MVSFHKKPQALSHSGSLLYYSSIWKYRMMLVISTVTQQSFIQSKKASFINALGKQFKKEFNSLSLCFFAQIIIFNCYGLPASKLKCGTIVTKLLHKPFGVYQSYCPSIVSLIITFSRKNKLSYSKISISPQPES